MLRWFADRLAPHDAWGARRQWPAGLLFLAGALKAGLPLEEALEAFVAETPEPLRSILIARRGESSSWLPVRTRIERLLQGDALALARAALLLSHNSGGQAAQLLERSAQTLQMKNEMADRAAALSAQGRLSAWVVGLTPFGILFLFSIVSPDYVAPLFKTRQGWMVLVLVAIMVGSGLALVHKMVDIEP